MNKKAKKERRRKATRRVPVAGLVMLRLYGVKAGDVAVIAMTGEVRPGELGYFLNNRKDGDFKHFAFASPQDAGCHDHGYSAARTPESVCLRRRPDGECEGEHTTAAYGRVVAFERDRRPVETTLQLRPYDEREGGPTTRLDAKGGAGPVTGTRKAERGGGETVKVIPPEGGEGHEFGVVTISDDNLETFGYRRGDQVLVDLSAELKDGALCVVYMSDGESSYIGHFRVTPCFYFLKSADGMAATRIRRSEVERAGAVSGFARVVDEHGLEWPTVITPTAPAARELTPAQKARLAELRRRLKRLDEEDDQIIRCTERFKIEKEIYDIEHGTGGDEGE